VKSKFRDASSGPDTKLALTILSGEELLAADGSGNSTATSGSGSVVASEKSKRIGSHGVWEDNTSVDWDALDALGEFSTD